MVENIVLAVFVALPLLLAGLTVRFLRADAWRSGLPKWAELVLGNGLVLSLLLSVGLLGGEVYYRFVYDTTDGAALNLTTRKWFERHFHTNNVGLRDNVDYLMQRSDRPRVVFFGDSFTAGHGIADVEDRFANRVRAARPDLEIVVEADLGWGTAHHLWALQKILRTGYRFDTMVLVYLPNDIDDLVPGWSEVMRRHRNDFHPGFLFRHSYLLNTLYAAWYRHTETELERYDDLVVPAYAGRPWQIERRRLMRIKRLAEGAGAQFLVVTFPLFRTLGPDNPYAAVHARLDRFWSDLGVPHLDLLPTFTAHAGEDLVVSPTDNHPNEAAHAIAAREILRFLDENPPTAHRPAATPPPPPAPS